MSLPMTTIEMGKAIYHKVYGNSVDPDDREAFLGEIITWLGDGNEYSSDDVIELATDYARKIWDESGMGDWRSFPGLIPDPPKRSILDIKR